MTQLLFKCLFLILLTMSLIIGGEKCAVAIEEVPYTVIEQNGDFEVRQYSPHIVAETTVDGAFDQVGSEGFRRLAGYINGENQPKQSIAMTAPVSQETQSEKIAMTAPVGQEKSGDRWRITFVMPAKYALDTLPEPVDSRIRLKQEPGRLMATVRYSGTWSRKGYEDNKKRLLAWIEKQGFKQNGDPVWARYNPPFMPWFLRRNEILIPVDTHN
ncbi:MAG: heme-binding protein [Desulfobacterales bacterium]|jgi:effector-binding domain-containing protein